MIVRDMASKTKHDIQTNNTQDKATIKLNNRQRHLVLEKIVNDTTHRLMLGRLGCNERLGNQMFQYASLLGIAAKQNRDPFFRKCGLISSTFQTNAGHLVLSKDVTFGSWNALREQSAGKFDKRLFGPLPEKNVQMQGYTQSFKYFHDIDHEIKKEFRFNKIISEEADVLFYSIVPFDEKTVCVGIHVRRGDFLTPVSVKLGRLVAPKSYFDKAMNYFRDKYKHVKFLVTSNPVSDDRRMPSDVVWVTHNIQGEDVVIVNSASAEVRPLCTV